MVTGHRGTAANFPAQLAQGYCPSSGGCERRERRTVGCCDTSLEPQGARSQCHSKVVVIDDTWAMVGSDNMNRRSWTHHSELSCAVLDATPDPRAPHDPGGLGDGARVFARDLRLELWREHLDATSDDGLLDPADAFESLRTSAKALQAWYDGGCSGARPAGRLRPHVPERVPRAARPWAVPVSRLLYDPDGRAWRDRIRHRM